MIAVPFMLMPVVMMVLMLVLLPSEMKLRGQMRPDKARGKVVTHPWWWWCSEDDGLTESEQKTDLERTLARVRRSSPDPKRRENSEN